YVRKHLIFLACGVAATVVVSRVHLRWFERLAYPLLLAFLTLLALLLIPGIGVTHGGARRWVGAGPLSLQPSEFFKTVIGMYLARSIVRKRERMTEFSTGVLPHVLVVGLAMLAVAAQPDFGTAVILVLVLVLMLWVGGARPAHLMALVLAALPVIGVALVHAPYRWRRIL